VLQYYLQVKDYGGESVLGGLATSGTIREIGPLLIAFMLAGKIGAFTSAELGTMKVTYQMECIRSLGTHPIAYLIVPRYLAVVLGSLILLCFGMFISVFGGLLSSWVINNINPLQFLGTIPRFTSAASVGMAFIKALFFGLLMGQISCANGYWTTGGSVGVGEAVKKTAVHSMVSITIADVVLTFFITSAFRWLGWFES
jgi:phospholipid/cholesterol/gamma-HCH transport system permease protein